ncbi:hypothetical protein DASC09_035010 [Saccharomycopsis crataegensis]|uniref:D-isomer specific 2-hydroxyacid dehydrogenase NAD-binding domain-containing protein n=1 Tax=Saccharomycopsis crataegensis TaxID=43959 RepID=A0AAV5QN94_9ASCO|nr:hypothetical protein DASC09_035010 [Saccharomycopsis crataegensis]
MIPQDQPISSKPHKYFGDYKYAVKYHQSFYKNVKGHQTPNPRNHRSTASPNNNSHNNAGGHQVFYPPPPMSNPLVQTSGYSHDIPQTQQFPQHFNSIMIPGSTGGQRVLKTRNSSKKKSLALKTSNSSSDMVSLLATAVLNDPDDGLSVMQNYEPQKFHSRPTTAPPMIEQYLDLDHQYYIPSEKKPKKKKKELLGAKKESLKKQKQVVSKALDPQDIKQLLAIGGGVFGVILLIFLGIIFYQRNTIFLAEHSKAKYIKHPKIAAFHPLALDKDIWDDLRLNYNAEVIQIPTNKMKTREDFIYKLSQYTDYNILVTSKLTDGLIGTFDEEIIGMLPETTVAVINSDLRYNSSIINQLTQRNIQFSYNINSELKDNSTADTHMFLMLSAMRNYQESIQNLLRSYEENMEYESRWTSKPWLFDFPPEPLESIYTSAGKAEFGFLPNGKVLGILGMNGVGKAIASRARPFNFKRMIYHDEYQLPTVIEQSLGLEYVTLEELLKISDIFSINIREDFPTSDDHVDTSAVKTLSDVARKQNGDEIPGSKSKYYRMINNGMISSMKDGVILVNTASEKLINFKSIKKYLGNGKIRSMATDSIDFNDRKLVMKLLKMPNLILTPQTNLYSQQVINGDDEWAVKNIKNILEFGRVLNIVPEQRHMEFKFDYFVM